jgi:predicted AAA+ superfamily ATPase
MITRDLSARLRSALASFPVVFLTGPRQSGKTTLARTTEPDYRYISFEDLHNRDEALRDPVGFLRRLEGAPGIILDEAQRVPELFSYLQGFADDRRGGPVVLTGSQNFLMLERVSQSLAGRAAVLELLPFSLAEAVGRSGRAPAELESGSTGTRPPGLDLDQFLFEGMYPRIRAERVESLLWLDSYLRTYVERDVRTLHNVGDLDAFTRFLGLCAGRTGQLLDLTSLGSDAGVSHTTVRRWLSVLEASYVVRLLRPHHQNFSKRLVKTPKLYFFDTGLLCRLLGLRQAADVHVHPLRGAIFECFVFSELQKLFLHQGERPPVYFWRDSRGHEVDFVVDLVSKRVPIEAKSGLTVADDALDGLDRYLDLSHDAGGLLVYGGDEARSRGRHQLRPWWALS